MLQLDQIDRRRQPSRPKASIISQLAAGSGTALSEPLAMDRTVVRMLQLALAQLSSKLPPARVLVIPPAFVSGLPETLKARAGKPV